MPSSKDYVTRIHRSILEIDARQWNALLEISSAPTPFMRHEYLAALHHTDCASENTGWDPHFIALYDNATDALLAACPLYLKTHSYGEYVFDWAWARAYQEHGMAYYPKAVVAVPFTPVSGSRFLCQNGFKPAHLLRDMLSFCEQKGVSSAHILFASQADQQLCANAALMLRETVQFHWSNASYASFENYLNALSQEKRKKIRAEQRKVQQAGVSWQWRRGADIQDADWDFFYECYERTYLEHGNAPYLSGAFFHSMQSQMPQNWLLFTAYRQGKPIACSLVCLSSTIDSIASCADFMRAGDQNGLKNVAYGRYWGTLERVDSLHFDACYYQPLQWCIEHRFDRFEGGAQGEHKMARGLLPVVTRSAHWLAHPQFAQAVQRYLLQEKQGIDGYVEHLDERNPFRKPPEGKPRRATSLR